MLEVGPEGGRRWQDERASWGLVGSESRRGRGPESGRVENRMGEAHQAERGGRGSERVMG